MTLKYLLQAPSMLLQGTYEGLLWGYYPLLTHLSSSFPPLTQWHVSLSDWMRESTIHVLPSHAIWTLLKPPSLKPSWPLIPQALAYKLNPLPSHFINNLWSKVIMLVWEPNPHQSHTSTPKIHQTSIEAHLSYWAYIPKSYQIDPSLQQRKASLREPTHGSYSHLRTSLWSILRFMF